MADSPKYLLHPKAEQDIAGIWHDGANRWGVEQADRYFDGMVGLFDLLTEQPEIARLRPEFRPPVRLHPYGSHLIIYETNQIGITIIRVLHNRRNIVALLGP